MLKPILSLVLLCGISVVHAELIISEQIHSPYKSLVKANINRLAIPPTPNNMILPEFGKGIIGWGSGPKDAETRFLNVTKADVAVMKTQGVTLQMAQAWQAFYENETQRNPGNPTAPFRAQLMKKIVSLW